MDTDVHKLTGLDIAAEFPPHTWEEWKLAVEETLKGVPFEKAMITKTYEGIDLKPIYRKEDIQNLPHLDTLPGQAPFVRGNNAEGYIVNGWQIAQKHTCWKPADVNKIILDELNRGLTAVNLKLDKFTRWAIMPPVDELTPDGIRLSNLEDAEKLLTRIDLSAVPLMVDGGEASLIILGLINAYLKKHDIPAEKLTGLVGFDLLAALTEEGELPFTDENKWLTYCQLCSWASLNAPGLRTILLDGSFWGNCGASSSQELAYVISTANEYIKAMLDRGLNIEAIVPRFQLNLTLGSNLFMEIAKVRAARLLWAELMKAYNVPEDLRKIWIHGVTSGFNKTMYDPFVNVLRTATESFSGVIGGIDSLEVTPFDATVRAETEFSRRIARNQQIILMEEAHLSKVTDPAGGCYYIETMTSQLAELAWSKMQSIEEQGGFYEAVKDGTVQAEVSKTALERMHNADKRKDVFVGINMFANTLEQPLEATDCRCQCDYLLDYERITAIQDTERAGLDNVLHELEANRINENAIELVTEALLKGATLEETADALFELEHDLTAITLNKCRATMGLELLRSRITAYQQENETVLSVFLANMGPISQHKARADFAMGFLQVGGFYVANYDGFETVEAAAEAAVFSKAQAVCICSTDDTYPELVPLLIDRIKTQKADMIFILAGYPQDMAETYKQQGINVFVHIRANALDILTDLANGMGVK